MANENFSKIIVQVKYSEDNLGGIPIFAQVLKVNSTAIESFWTDRNKILFENLAKANYIIRLSFASGFSVEQFVEADAFENFVQFDLSEEITSSKPITGLNWKYFSKRFHGITNAADQQIDLKKSTEIIEASRARFWRYERGQWLLVIQPDPFAAGPNRGDSFEIRTDESLYGMEVLSPNTESKFVLLPAKSKITIWVMPASGPKDFVHPIEITMSTDYWQAEVLLTLFTRGAINKNDQLFAEVAEKMLYNKRENPVKAAIGAYYLLKIKDLERLHNWANNLANWFDWLPDGPIIHAWQIISDANQTNSVISIARERLLQAVSRGTPIYTEGLRLLRDGLELIYNLSDNNDKEVSDALDLVRSFTQKVDWTQETTTIIGFNLARNNSFDFEPFYDDSVWKAGHRKVILKQTTDFAYDF